MSRIGKLPIPVPDGVKVGIDKNNNVTIEGAKGKLTQSIHPDITVKHDKDQIVVSRPTDAKHHRALHGLFRSLIANMVQGVSQGYEKQLEIVGVGYRARMKGKKVNLELGYSHPILFSPPDEITIETPSDREVIVRGIDKQLVGQVAAKIRSFRVPEPYKGKGVRYTGEYVRRKAGKAAGA